MSILRSQSASYLWLVLRVWLGWRWLESGLGKWGNPAWTGANAGAAITGFFKGAIAGAAGEHPSVLPWYASFLRNVGLPNARFFSFLVPIGEVAVGVALILGFLTTFAALVGAFMNLNFMMAGSAGINPYMYTVAIILAVAGYSAGRIGLDRYVLPWLGRRMGDRSPGGSRT